MRKKSVDPLQSYCATSSRAEPREAPTGSSADSLSALLPQHGMLMPATLVGELVAVTKDAQCALVRFPGQRGTAAVPARTVVEVGPGDIGKAAVLVFDGGDADRPILMGFIRIGQRWSLAELPAQVEVDADGQRMLINAKHELVLRCGKASITLSASGKVVVQASHIVSESSGLHRIRGASVEIN